MVPRKTLDEYQQDSSAYDSDVTSIHIAKLICRVPSIDQDHSCQSIFKEIHYMGVSKNSGTSKWMVYNRNPYQNG